MDLFTELNSKSNISDVLSNKSIIDELQEDLLTQINERGTNLPKYIPRNEIPLELVNREFYDRNFYFGVINPQNTTYQYKLVPGEGDNNQFIIIKNIVYSVFPFVFNKSEYSITIEALDPISLNISIKSFKIKSYNPNRNYNTADIMSCHDTQTLPIIFNGLIDSIEIKLNLFFSHFQGSIRQQTTNSFIYTPPTNGTAPDDIIAFNIINTNNGEIIDTFVIMIEVFDDNRIQNLPRQKGTYRFNNILFDIDTSMWKLGNFSTKDFYTFNSIYVIRNLYIFFNEFSINDDFLADPAQSGAVVQEWLKENTIGLTEDEARKKINSSLNLKEAGNLKDYTLEFNQQGGIVTGDYNIMRIRLIVDPQEGRVNYVSAPG